MEVIYFALKALIVVLSFASIILLIALLAARASHKNELEVEQLHKRYKNFGLFLKSFTASKEERKETKKQQKAEEKEKKKKGDSSASEKRVFVLNFDGDTKATQVENLREEISAVLQTATPNDEVVLRLESPGGMVHGYGLAASQLTRLRDKNIPLTVCVDGVAASGGYMMACVANRIIAAPFAIVGSIGVVAQVPNFHKILKKNDVDYKEYTAGEFKRTISLLGEITPQGESHFINRINDTHVLFKSFVHRFRPQVDLQKVATGDYWFGIEAKELQLIDEIKTSDDYLLSFEKDTPIFELTYQVKEGFSEKISHMLGKAATTAALKTWEKFEQKKFL